MGYTAVFALAVFIIVILIWALVIKRNISEGMIIGFLITLLFAGDKAFELFWPSLMYAMSHEVVFASLAFMFMSQLISYTRLIDYIIGILNSLVGRLPGGAAYVNTLGSTLFSTVAGSGPGIAATTGSITIPWMVRSKWKKEDAVTIVSGNAGLGGIIPPNSAMFILLGFGSISALVTQEQLFAALYVAGFYAFIHRMLVVFIMTKKYNIGPVPKEQIRPLKETFREGWSSLIIFVGLLLPVILTLGPGAQFFASLSSIGEAMEAISFIVWVPVFMIIFTLIIGRKRLPKNVKEWSNFIDSVAPSFAIIGPVLIFTFATSEVLSALNLSDQLQALVGAVNLPVWMTILLCGLIITIVGIPLTTTATVATVGLPVFSILASVGIDPVVILAAILLFAATEGSTPTSPPIYVAAGIANVSADKSYKPLMIYYTIPLIVIGWLVAIGILPIPIL